MGNANARRTEPFNFVFFEMNTVSKPHIISTSGPSLAMGKKREGTDHLMRGNSLEYVSCATQSQGASETSTSALPPLRFAM